MYADRFQSKRGMSPGGIAMATGATGLVLLGIATAAPKIVGGIIKDPPIVIRTIPIPKDPPPIPPEQARKQPEKPPITTVDRIVDPPVPQVDRTEHDVDVTPPQGNDGGSVGTGTGSGGGVVIDPPRPPVLIGSTLDPRYMAEFQPYYPPDERRAGREGRVVIRVLIGTDGRVHAVEPVSATTESFLQATRRRALERWRFRPATRDGVAVESWREMAVSFRLEDLE